MSVSTPWLGSTPASTARKNKTSVISDSGANMSLYDKTKFAIVACNATGGGYELDHVYLFCADGETVVDLTELSDHTHTTIGDGGAITRIWMDTPEHIDLLLIKSSDIVKESWIQTVTGTGSIENVAAAGTVNEYIRLRPNGTSGSGATIQYPCSINVDFDQPSILTAKGSFETASSLAFHVGVNADDVTAADSNTIKYQAEVCTTTNNNWFLRTANGSAHSAGDTGVAIDTNNHSIKIVHDPNAGTPYARMEVNAANSFTKTTNIPTTGSTTTNNILKFSQKNSTAADRPYRVHGARLSFITGSIWSRGGTNA